MPEAPSGRGSFAPVVLLGLATAGLAAVGSAKPWIGGGAAEGSHADTSMAALDSGTRFPLASAVSLVLLATWGVLLVTRRGVRRVFAWLTVVGALALLGSVIAGYVTLPDVARDSFDEMMGRGTPDTGFNGWFFTTAVCSVLALVPAVLAVRLVGTWPEMGSRYDAPGAPAAPEPQATLDADRDLWRAQDEGHDPTDTGRG